MRKTSYSHSKLNHLKYNYGLGNTRLLNKRT